MPRNTCSICTHVLRGDIEIALRNNASLDRIAKDFGVGRASVYRHKKKCDLTTLRAAGLNPDASRIDIRAGLVRLLDRCERNHHALDCDKSRVSVLKTAPVIRELYLDIEKLQGPEVKELEPWKHPEVLGMLSRIYAVMQAYPEVREALLAAVALPAALPEAIDVSGSHPVHGSESQVLGTIDSRVGTKPSRPQNGGDS